MPLFDQALVPLLVVTVQISMLEVLHVPLEEYSCRTTSVAKVEREIAYEILLHIKDVNNGVMNTVA